jgi:hypothetical protein
MTTLTTFNLVCFLISAFCIGACVGMVIQLRATLAWKKSSQRWQATALAYKRAAETLQGRR